MPEERVIIGKNKALSRQGITDHALAGYNGGPGNARRWLNSDDDLFVEKITLPETRNDIEWVYEHWHAYQHIYRRK